MKKWSNGAKKRKVVLDAEAVKADDLDVMVSAMAKLPPGQLKKVLTSEVIAVLEKYGVSLE